MNPNRSAPSRFTVYLNYSGNYFTVRKPVSRARIGAIIRWFSIRWARNYR